MPVRRRFRPALAIVFAVALTAVLAGCSKGAPAVTAGSNGRIDTGTATFTTETGKKTVDIKVVDNTYEPSYIEVSPGTKLVFTNDGRVQHTVTPVDSKSFKGISKDDFGPGKSGSVTVGGAGDYAFYCTIHGTKTLRGQSGVIRVVAG